MYDYVIIGAGIVGVSTAWQLQMRHPNKKILLVEKEHDYALHQTGRNSGVIHAGVYYPPDSLKAQFCRQGRRDTMAFCDAHAIPYRQCGKLIVATNTEEHQQLTRLYARCQQNQLSVEWLDSPEALKAREPHINGIAAIFVPETGIVNYRQVCEKMGEIFRQNGGEIRFSHHVVDLHETTESITLSCRHQAHMTTIETRFLIACAGLGADRVAKMLDIALDFRIIPYRGEYYALPEKYSQAVNHLIYPVPNPELPFLGVHLTHMIDGKITVGPNAVQAFKREGYGRYNFSFKDTLAMLRFIGFWRVTFKYFKTGMAEIKNSWCKSGYLKTVQKYLPTLSVDELAPYPVGIRAQAIMQSGELVHDFLFATSARSLHVCNAPSPAATSAIPIAKILQMTYATGIAKFTSNERAFAW